MSYDKKLISVVVPIYNEESMVNEIYSRVSAVFETIDDYAYEIVFFDDGSNDGTKNAIEELCEKHEEVKGIFFAKNFGYLKNTFYSMQQAKGDCAIILHADLQNPPELIPEFIKKWEKGAQVVQGVKNKSRENKLMYFFRTVFYFLMIRFFGVKLTPHATEFELFDRSFIELLKNIKANNPFLRGIVSEFASEIDYVYYTQDARKKGKSKFNINKYYDFAICGITQYSCKLPRKVIFVCIAFFIAAIVEFCLVILPAFKDTSALEIMNSIIIRCIFIALCLFIILVSIIFEYIITITDNIGEKPFIIEEKRIKY